MAAIGGLDLFLLAGFVGGISSFFRGFRSYRKFLLLEDTPTTPIRSIAMGLVRIHGKVTADHTIESPITRSACCAYQVHIERWKDEEDSGRWLHYGADTNGVSFRLQDDSGRVLVDPRGAEFDIESTGAREVSSMRDSSGSDAALLAYVLRVGPSDELPGSRHNLELERVMLLTSKLKEERLTPDELMQRLTGPTIQQSFTRIQQSLEDEGPQSDPLREELRQAQIDLYKHPVWTKEYAAGARHVNDLIGRVRKAGLLTETPPPPKSAKLPYALAGDVGNAGLTASPSSKLAVSASAPSAEELVASTEGLPTARGRYRLTERCILPGHEYDITGTCTINPLANGDDRSVIRKGTNEPTFLISGLARTDVNAMQKMRSYLMIFGGGMLAVFCLGILLLRFGQF